MSVLFGMTCTKRRIASWFSMGLWGGLLALCCQCTPGKLRAVKVAQGTMSPVPTSEPVRTQVPKRFRGYLRELSMRAKAARQKQELLVFACYQDKLLLIRVLSRMLVQSEKQLSFALKKQKPNDIAFYRAKIAAIKQKAADHRKSALLCHKPPQLVYKASSPP